MLKRAVPIAFVAWIATIGAAMAEPPTAAMPHPDPKMPPMPSMEGPDPTGDLAKPPLTKPSAPISSSKVGASVAVKAKRTADSNRKHAAAPGGSKTSRAKPAIAKPVLSKPARGKAALAKPAGGKASSRKAEARRGAKATGRVAVSTHGKVKVRPAVKHKKR